MDKYDINYLRGRLSDGRFQNVVCFDKIGSTSTFARNADINSVIFADEQTEGRGRQGKSFISPRGGVYFSMALPDDSGDNLTLKAAVAVMRAVKKTVGVDTYVKWVNDIIYNGKKLCGILTEKTDNRVIVGIGLNFYPLNEPSLANIATSLFKSRRASIARQELAVAIIKEFETLLDGGGNYMDEYRNRSVVLGKVVEYTLNGRQKRGVATQIDDDGTLKVEGESTDFLKSGEVSVKYNV